MCVCACVLSSCSANTDTQLTQRHVGLQTSAFFFKKKNIIIILGRHHVTCRFLLRSRLLFSVSVEQGWAIYGPGPLCNPLSILMWPTNLKKF